MSTKCRFKQCKWTGSFDDIFSHCENCHPKYIREHKGNNYYDFDFDDIATDAFLLCGPSGIYWFCTDPNDEVELNHGVFHIGDSEPIYYTIKMGLNRDGHAEYLGPFKSLCADTDETYEVELEYDYIRYLNEEIPSRKMRLYVGEYDDSDDVFAPTWKDLSFSEEDEELNKKCVENFTCCVCYEFIKRDIRFCENTHYVCLTCFENMQEHGKLRCPVCRTDYPYDCSDPDLERFLRMVRFPDNIKQRRDSENDDNAERQEEKRPRYEEEPSEVET